MAGPQQRFKVGPRVIGSLILWGGLVLYVGLLAGAYEALRETWKIYVAIPLLAILVPLPLLAVLSRMRHWTTARETTQPRMRLPETMGGSPALVAHLSGLVAEYPQADCFLCGIDLFFDGNDEPASIAGNMPCHPGLAVFRNCLAEIQARAEVQEVLIGVVDFAEGEWPYADTILVFTSAAPEAVSSWVARIDPDAVGPDLRHSDFAGLPACQPGMQPVYLWWD